MVNSNWHTAVVGLQHLKEGLECFCDDVIKQQHGRFKIYCRENCTECELISLKPNHICDRENKCPLGQSRCNCQKQSLRPCPNETCSVIYDEIIKDHGSSPPSPNWNNTDIKQWYTNPWAIAGCFIKGTGYDVRKCAAEFDCSGLLSVIKYNKAFLAHLQCDIDDKDAFTKAIKIRNALFHSTTLEIKEEQAYQYIDDMIAVLEDGKELLHRKESRAAVQRLKALKERIGHTETNDEKINDVLRNTKQDPNIAIQYIKEKIKSIDKDRGETNSEDLDFELPVKVTKKQTDPRKAIVLLTKCVYEILLKIEDIKKSIGDKIAEDSELLHAAQDSISNDPTYALQLLTVGMLWPDVRQLHKNVVRGTKEETKKYEMPTIDRPHDGRLITLSRDEVKGLLDNCDSNAARKGGFGEVYFTEKEVPGLNIRVAIKKIDCRKENEHYSEKLRSASNEKIASRVMHFAIVPLIAYMDEDLDYNRRAFYFISPYFENRSLREVIAKDKQCSNIKNIHLSSFRRKKILFQTASALDYLHTPVLGSRGIVLHMDLSSTNIVLDKNWNARLIDFGLGREMGEGKSAVTLTRSKMFGQSGYWPTDNYSKLTVYDEHYNFGVVTRELLTGIAPFINEETQLRKSSERIIELQLQKNIWTELEEASILIKLSTKCLKSRKDKNVSSADILKDIKKMFQDQSSTRSTSNTSTCDLCIVNPSVDGKRAPPHQCSERVNVCTSCMRNSHVNPIRCPTCNETVFPKIGHTYAAVLIAGNDDKNEGLAKSFRSDVLALKDVLSSKCPCVIGIRDENIKLIAPSSPGKADKLNLQVHEAFRSLESKQNLGTLLVYFTGHYSPDKGFTLGGPDDVLTLTEIQDEIRNIYTQWGETARILMFLDCCEAPCVTNIPKLYVKMIQINACRPAETCYEPVSGSKFRIFFCQALTRRAFNKKCYNFNRSSLETECEDCVMSEEIITVHQLQTYIEKHMDKCFKGKDPILYVHGATADDSCIGYNVDFVVDLKFLFKAESGTTDVVIKHEMFCDIKSLKKHILETVLGETAFDGKLKLTPVEFSDAVALHIHDGSQHGLELVSMQNVSWALDGKRQIVACYRTLPNILKGLVVVFIETTYITEYLSSKGFLVEQEDGMNARFSFEKLESRYKETEKEIANTSSKMSQDIKDALRRFLHELLKVIEKWDQTVDKDSRELKIFFPCLTDNKWHDFMLMDLSVCQNS